MDDVPNAPEDAPSTPADTAGRLHHVELYASDLDASVRFWSWLLGELGYEPSQDFDGGRSWRLDPTYLVLVQAPDEYAAEEYHRRQPGLNHLAFHAGDRAQVDALAAGVRERDDATLLYPDDHPHAGGADHYALYCEDPERVKVEVVAPD
jgi:catechol 2,3-dioxygenase-like lactoylglutathione lyase family enzyme